MTFNEFVNKSVGKVKSKATKLKDFLNVNLFGEKNLTFKNVTIRLSVSNEETLKRSSFVKNKLMKEIFREINDGDVFYDIGANIGKVSCLVGEKLQSGKVFAFEPDPKNVKVIRNNFEKNSVKGKVLKYALSDESGKIPFFVPGKSERAGTSNSAIAPSKKNSDFWKSLEKKVYVDAMKGDDIVDQHSLPQPNIVKMDIEGAELKATRGLRKTLSHNACRVFICEVHEYLIPDFGGTSSELEKLILDIGFDIKTFDKRKQVIDREDGPEEVSLYRIKATK